ncbi:MAG: SPOR domain-containing protein [Hydrogenophaga sp.]|uniref:SPOR domain-containing protein n=1 Tax=Hydrogenophaga sp. TaxID=1904254 RepID=UPI002607980B|nr:SPOR domain-containing protein [Hydrogenophaga sp.]MCV0438621.1 SPOR domain-containing protein [Hydrogenophaga sp.]
MLRWAVLLLVLANVGYFAWTQGQLDGLGLAPVEQSEPQRLAQQVQPEVVRLLNGPKGASTPDAEPAVAASAPAAAPVATPEPAAPPEAVPTPSVDSPPAVMDTPVAPPRPATPPSTPTPTTSPAVADSGPRACWLAGAFTESQLELLRAELALLGLPASQWQFTETRSGGRWIVYMGRYDNTEQVERKKAELRALGVSFREITAPGLAPGLALGTYSSESAAQQALRQVEQDGVRTAKVAQERAESVSYTLRLPAITEAQRAAVDGLDEAMAGKTLRRCV